MATTTSDSTSEDTFPLVICGKGESLAVGFIRALHPEIETVHLCLTLDDSVAQVPVLLAGETPAANFSLGRDLVSKNYAHSARRPLNAVLVGGGFSDAEAAQIQNAAAQNAKARPVYWLRRDMTKNWGNPMEDWEAYAKLSAERLKVALGNVKGTSPQTHQELLY